MNTNLFLELNGLFVSPFLNIREYSCLFVAEILFLEIYSRYSPSKPVSN